MPSRADDIEIIRDAPVPMRDGVVLRADIYRPTRLLDVTPVLLQRTPYDKSLYTELGRMYADAGYIAVIQDVRGQFSSDGVWEPFVHEADDGEDSVTWAAALEGSDGQVGMMGTSYQATCAWQAAARRPPALRALACAFTPLDYYSDWMFPGGAFSLSFASTWLLRNVAHSAAARIPDGIRLQSEMDKAYRQVADRWYGHLPLRDFPPLHPDRDDVAPYFFDWIEKHPTRDAYWQEISLRDRIADVDIPALNIAGWYDVFVRAGVEAQRRLPADSGSALIVGPWAHNQWGPLLGEIDYGPDAAFSFPRAVIGWMDRWLKSAVVEHEPAPVQYFSMGDLTWRESATWPPAAAHPTALHLSSSGSAAADSTDGMLSIALPDPGSDSFVYDPADPVPSIGGQGCCYGPQSPIGPRDQLAIELRDDVLLYSSAPVQEPLEVAGDVEVSLYASTTADDTDFTAKLVDVHPDGTAINLAEGIVRGRFREGVDTERPLAPGAVQHYRIGLQPTANVFLRGHRIRVEISSSNFPMYDRNPNTGAPFGQNDELVVATQTVHHGGEHPSALILPVIARTR
ncbi:MAG: CocE/NonD family hydrolase [Microbacterium sp.]